ncbi:hypothetical protein PUV54_07180 [Hyphococcus flavus]|uniref:Uncharacterized protein n=1 Tax=Hyphococcus flavus TaxID=1866326 RepID=A0AAE9ZDD9_9PROT|nr:hypothetical protein [Hyphococcus flavus]WDI32978.1 hypothetical protein PUV54_07180 [Hyphococcus flavus]
MKLIATFAALTLMSTSLSGCLLGAAAGAGAIGYDEATEGDGEFDPLEEAYDGDPDTKGPLDDDD